MGVSTNGQICYGLPFEEGTEFPWDERGDIYEWWIYDVLGFKHSKQCYGENGERLPGITEADISAYFAERRAFEKAHPLPVELVNYCSGDCEMYILAVPSSTRTARRGYPEQFQPINLTVTTEESAVLLDFCTQHGIEPDGEPRWLLSSYWG